MADRLEVVCREASHERKRHVATFERGPVPAPLRTPAVSLRRSAGLPDPQADLERSGQAWREVPSGRPRPDQRRAGLHLDLDRMTRTGRELVDDQVSEPDWRDEQPDPSAVRVRYRLRCGLCGLSLAVRDDTLQPVLDHLAGSGLSEISLKMLAAACR
jgi:hypothetical protein